MIAVWPSGIEIRSHSYVIIASECVLRAAEPLQFYQFQDIAYKFLKCVIK